MYRKHLSTTAGTNVRRLPGIWPWILESPVTPARNQNCTTSGENDSAVPSNGYLDFCLAEKNTLVGSVI